MIPPPPWVPRKRYRNRYGKTEDREGVPTARLFGEGFRARGYDLEAVCLTHQEALDEADTLRSMRLRARVVKCAGGRWAIYTRAA